MKAVNKKNNPEINRLSGKFYSLIPHDFGFQKMINFILNDKDKI
jgi:poly [ADP-ribose] polymerase